MQGASTEEAISIAAAHNPAELQLNLTQTGAVPCKVVPQMCFSATYSLREQQGGV